MKSLSPTWQKGKIHGNQVCPKAPLQSCFTSSRAPPAPTVPLPRKPLREASAQSCPQAASAAQKEEGRADTGHQGPQGAGPRGLSPAGNLPGTPPQSPSPAASPHESQHESSPAMGAVTGWALCKRKRPPHGRPLSHQQGKGVHSRLSVRTLPRAPASSHDLVWSPNQ